ELELEAHREAVLENPRRELRRIKAARHPVRRADRREQHGLRLGAVRGQHAPRELVVVAVAEDELDLVMGPQEAQVRVRLLRLHRGAGALHVHDIPDPAARPLLRHQPVEGLQIHLAIGLEGMDVALRKTTDRGGDRLRLKERLAPGPADMSDAFPFPGGGRQFANPLCDVVDGGSGEFTALDRVHGVAPGAPQIACVQAHEDGREACERTLSLDRDVHLVEEELLPLSDGDGRLGLHDATDARGPTYAFFAADPAYGSGSWIPASRKPLRRSWQESQTPQAFARPW